MSHWNWPGILLITLILPAAGVLQRTLSWLAERGARGVAGEAEIHNAGRWPLAARPSNAIDSSNYQPPPHETCVFDVERSSVVMCLDGSMMVGCAFNGCTKTKTYPETIAVAKHRGIERPRRYRRENDAESE